MKELSIKEKAERYDEAIDDAKVIHKTIRKDLKPVIEQLFPELKESEDEKIRKDIIIVLEREATRIFKETGSMPIWYDKAIAYLEKQGEKKPVVPKFRVGDFVKDTNYHGEPIYEIVGMDNECYICQYRGNKSMGDRGVMHFAFDNPYLRLVEQKPAEWSEEDKEILSQLIEHFDYKREFTEREDFNIFLWLKALKSKIQAQWKPSKEQMEALNTASMLADNDGDSVLLGRLYDELKKL